MIEAQLLLDLGAWIGLAGGFALWVYGHSYTALALLLIGLFALLGGI